MLVLDLVRVRCYGLVSFNSLYELDLLDLCDHFPRLSQQLS